MRRRIEKRLPSLKHERAAVVELAQRVAVIAVDAVFLDAFSVTDTEFLTELAQFVGLVPGAEETKRNGKIRY